MKKLSWAFGAAAVLAAVRGARGGGGGAAWQRTGAHPKIGTGAVVSAGRDLVGVGIGTAAGAVVGTVLNVADRFGRARSYFPIAATTSSSTTSKYLSVIATLEWFNAFFKIMRSFPELE